MKMDKITEIINAYNVKLDYSNFKKDLALKDEKDEQATERKQQLHVGRAVKLYNTMKKSNATEAELFAVWMYLMVCLDARKHRLDIDAAADQLNFKELEKRYMK